MAKPTTTKGAPAKQRSITLYLVRTLPATRAEVWRMLTTPREAARWWGPEEGYTLAAFDFDPKPKGKWRIGMKPPGEEPYFVSGVFRDVRPEEWIVFSWEWEGEHTWSTVPAKSRPPETAVALTLREREGGRTTELFLTHDGFRDEKDRDEHAWGWRGCLTRLANSL